MTPTSLWMRDHPADTPCPASFNAARAWRRKRGIPTVAYLTERGLTVAEYSAALDEAREYADTNGPAAAAPSMRRHDDAT